MSGALHGGPDRIVKQTEARFLRDLPARIVASAVAWAWAVTALRGVGFLTVTLYALRTLPASRMGLWYVMLNLAGLATMVELGFSLTIARFVSYFYGGATSVPRLGLKDLTVCDAANYRGVAGLAVMARRLYARFALAVVVFMGMAGLGWYLWRGGRQSVTAGDAAAYVLLTVGSGVAMRGWFWNGLLFGMNRVRLTNQLMVAGLLADYALAFAGLACGLGLHALVMGQLAVNLIPRWAAQRLAIRLIPEDAYRTPQPIAWLDLWPMTWRSGLAALSSGLYIQNTTLICSLVTDLRTTAEYGLTMQLAIMLHGFASAVLAVKHPEIAAGRAQGRLREVSRVIRLRMALALLVYLAGAALLLWLTPLLLGGIGAKTRLLPLPQAAALLALVGVDVLIGMHAAVVQTGNEVLHLKPYVISGLLTVPAAYLLGRRYGVWGILFASFFVQALFNYWRTPMVCWQRLRQDAHPSAAP